MANTVKKNKLITAANFKDFDWNKAKLFYHIAKCGSFTKAARLAGILNAH
jgi:molybdenum-dependent DNA-binding transcriptional regulator ModE